MADTRRAVTVDGEPAAGGWWDRRARAWSAHRTRIAEHLDTYGSAALRRLAATGGGRVLDAGCGPGFTLPALAGLVGRVRGTDRAPRMVRVARQICAGFPWVDVDAADLVTDDLAGPWDGVYARFSLMLVDDPVATLTNLHASTRPGGQLAFTTWASLGDNPWRWAPALAASAPSATLSPYRRADGYQLPGAVWVALATRDNPPPDPRRHRARDRRATRPRHVHERRCTAGWPVPEPCPSPGMGAGANARRTHPRCPEVSVPATTASASQRSVSVRADHETRDQNPSSSGRP